MSGRRVEGEDVAVVWRWGGGGGRAPAAAGAAEEALHAQLPAALGAEHLRRHLAEAHSVPHEGGAEDEHRVCDLADAGLRGGAGGHDLRVAIEEGADRARLPPPEAV